MKGPPPSGSEPLYTNRRWGTTTGIGNNNCYAYAVGDYEAYRWQKSIPGDRSGLSNGNHTYTIAQVFQTVSSPITLRRCTGSTLLKSVKRDTIKL
jgi:hypothetical protein